ncbi:phycobiliprotein lyase [Spirulina sp. 06S082]|uniref:phycobiliprotein lyase n=1 Tax=Spirulina sp. 06S082 TaxID=3110248 RepID=UPI002B209053|nr:phycobiliprotein lyase [Spirulina sp. 06S082]MEA5469251.1 phycobiliprotein lyase [Spirulina sp. 06S082]
MDIKTFLTNSEGEWFSQRTRYQVAVEEPDNSKSNLTVELLVDDPGIVGLCQQYNISATTISFGIKTSWDTSVDWGKPKQVGSSFWAIVPDEKDGKTGKVLRSGQGQNASSQGVYAIGADSALTLTIQDNNICTEERLWFASENLRLRTLLVNNGQEFTQMAFYSEIRRITVKQTDS